jgi:uncharacterized membrane protein
MIIIFIGLSLLLDITIHYLTACILDIFNIQFWENSGKLYPITVGSQYKVTLFYTVNSFG